ncbi:MAG TPA: DUF2071 domain-containing protein [Thermomicrobiales bacterium]|nr:DUF2071 domain-containing protein [Thermomicrobiales bacterium]
MVKHSPPSAGFDTDFDYVEHRPYPLASGPWVMGQRWHDLLFAHWRFEPEEIQALLPPSLTVDTFDGFAWLAVVPFVMADVRLRGFAPIPRLSGFLELNVRTYVRSGDLAGVYFFSLDAERWLAVRVARYGAALPYFDARMALRRRADWIGYRSRRTHRGAPAAELHAYYRPTGPVEFPRPGSLEYFLTERYRLLAARKDGTLVNIEIHHPPWPLQPAQCHIERNTMADWLGLQLDRPPDHLRFARFQDVQTWWPRPVEPPVEDPGRRRGPV